MAGKEIDRRDTYKKNKKSFEMLKKASGDKIKKLDFDPVALGIVTKKKDGGSQSTGSFFGDLKKAIKAGGSSKLTKKVKVMKGDTLGSIAKKHNTTIKMLQDLNYGLKDAEGQKTMEFKGGGYEGDTLRVPDPQSFQKGRLAPVRTKKKKNPYEGQKKSDMKEMNRKIMSDKDLKKQQEKVRKTPDRNAPVKKAMGGVMKARGGTFKGTY
jgi:hypothetical protein